MNGCGAVCGASHADRVNIGTLRGKSKIRRCVGFCIRVVAKAGLNLGGTFAENFPRLGAVDGFAVLVEPGADFQQSRAHLVRNRAVWPRSDVQEQVAVLADDVHQLMNQEVGRLQLIVLHISPGQIADRRIRLPVPVLDAGKQGALMIARAGICLHGIVLEIDDSGKILARGVVVVERGELGYAAPVCGVADAAIEIKNFRLVFFGQLNGAGQPVARPGLTHPRPLVVGDEVGVVHPGVSGAVERGVFRIVHIGADVAAIVVIVIVLGAMGRKAEMQSCGADCLGEVADDVTMRPHLYGSPVGEVGIVHRKSVVVLRNGDYVLCAGAFEQVGPAGGVPFFCAEFGNEILVAQIVQQAIIFLEVFVGGIPRAVHVVGIPFVDGAGNGVNTPSNENSKLGIFVPLRDFVVVESLPVGTVRTIVRLPLGLCN